MATKINRTKIGGFTNVRRAMSHWTYQASNLTPEDVLDDGFLDPAFGIFEVGDYLTVHLTSTGDNKLLKILNFVVKEVDSVREKTILHKMDKVLHIQNVE